MKWEQIEKMLDAGFSKDEIMKVYDNEQGFGTPSENPDPEPAAEPEPAAVGADPEPEPIPDYSKLIEQSIKDGFKELAAVIQFDAIGKSRQPAEQSNEDILAQIIAPAIKERGK